MVPLILTITLNPALDKLVAVPALRAGEANRVELLSTQPAGKGVDVAKVLRDMEAPVCATGFLGGAVAALAFAMDMPLVLILVGIIYILETLSDIIQIGYFKLTHGKRFFKMAPLHHHLELSGWSEAKLVAVFSTVTFLFCVLAYIGVQGRF